MQLEYYKILIDSFWKLLIYGPPMPILQPIRLDVFAVLQLKLHDIWTKEKKHLKKYILVLGLFALILMMPTAQATIANVVIDSTENVVEAGVEPPEGIEVAIDIKPDTLSPNSKCQWVTCYITPSEGYTAHDVDFSSVTLEGLPSLEKFCGIVDVDDDGVFEAMVKFDRSAFIEIFAGSENPVLLTITGMYNDGLTFTGTDTIILKLD